MCPICLAAAAQIVVGAVSTSSAAAVVLKKFRVKIRAGVTRENIKKGRIGHEHETGTTSESRIAS
jgi:hypothetical protein